ncbi:NirD/YgiW/YdeI family stress tolerance protein [Moraxella marmotae]|uniref:NirD/YgiW/YdeI family stress tolerance protein n=1 Tax=Moraxella marmotae TaxID=3344520 RepID=UPI0035D41A4D
MKLNKIAASAFAIAVLTACTANAHPVSATSGISTVATAKAAHDDAHITVKGKLVRFLGNEKFELQDRTGTIVVDIDDDYYYNPQELVGKTVTIYGEVDKNFGKVVKIDADHIQIH